MDTQLFPNYIYYKHPFLWKINKLLHKEFELLTVLIGNNIWKKLFLYSIKALVSLFFLSWFFFYNFLTLKNIK